MNRETPVPDSKPGIFSTTPLVWFRIRYDVAVHKELTGYMLEADIYTTYSAGGNGYLVFAVDTKAASRMKKWLLRRGFEQQEDDS